ncbi:MAG: acyltransferase family protein [Prevotella sp.]|nr:acyltransferase family protein [Prevotella sp.]
MERIKYIDFLKGIAILLVVLGHSVQTVCGDDLAFDNRLFNGIYSFHMPLFMYLSGFVCWKHGWGVGDMQRRAWQLLVPFFVYPVMAGLLLEWHFDIATWAQIIRSPESGLWFFYILFFINLYFVLIKVGIIGEIADNKTSRSKTATVLTASGLAAFLLFTGLSVAIRNRTHQSYDYGTSLFAIHSVFFMAGMLTKLYMDTVTNWLGKCWPVATLLWLILAAFWKFDHRPTFIDHPHFAIEMAYYYATAFMGILMMMSIGFRFIRNDSQNYFVNAISNLGTKTLGVYAIHRSLLLTPATIVVANLHWNTSLSIALAFILLLSGSLLLMRLFEMTSLTSTLLLGKSMQRPSE